MNLTSISLLQRLQITSPLETDWQRLHQIYVPMIRAWLFRIPGFVGDTDDIAQEVMLALVCEIRGFQRQREGSFRAWLRQIVINRVRNYWKATRRAPQVGFDPAEGFLERLADPHDQLAQEWDRDHDRYVFERLIAIVRPDFSDQTWEAFLRFGLQGQPAARVAIELEMSENAVLLAKSRVLKRLREEAGELLE